MDGAINPFALNNTQAFVFSDDITGEWRWWWTGEQIHVCNRVRERSSLDAPLHFTKLDQDDDSQLRYSTTKSAK